ncbi:MAG TPA: alpha/beta hydrolase, partial [Anaerolineales bacterium]|nr:alpha/beta hydrolase [Anaerolineales bacterium]
YALDFWGFGESGTRRATYAVTDFISLVDQFMEELGIARAPLVGHSMGGTVSLGAALQYPQRVQKVVVIGSPIDGASLALLLKMFGWKPFAALTYHNLWALKLGFRQLARYYSRDPRWPDMMDRDISRVNLESFCQSIASLRRTDLRPNLHQVQVPVMGMYGAKDIVVHPRQWRPLQESLPEARIERFSQAGHFIMLDDPQRFRSTLHEFLAAEPVSELAAQPAVTR